MERKTDLKPCGFFEKQFFAIRRRTVQEAAAAGTAGQVSREFFVGSRPRPANTKLGGKLADRTPKSWAVRKKQHFSATKEGTEETPAAFGKCAEPHEIKSEFQEPLHEIKSEFDDRAGEEPHEIKSEFSESLHEIKSERPKTAAVCPPEGPERRDRGGFGLSGTALR